MSQENEFNSRSYDAVLATILEKLDAQDKRAEQKAAEDKAAFEKMFQKQDTTNGRVSNLEKWKENLKGRIAGIAVTVSVIGTLIGWGLSWVASK